MSGQLNKELKMNNLSDRSAFKDANSIRIGNIERVFLNDTTVLGLNLTLLVRGKDNELVPYHGYFSRFHNGSYAKDNIPRIFADVPPDQSMWATVRQVTVKSFLETNYRYAIELHVHSGKDIDGGNWSQTDPNPPYTTRSGKVQPVA